MKHILALLLILAAAAGDAAADLEQHRAAIDELVAPLIENQVVVGLTVGLTDGDESLVLGYGRADAAVDKAPDANTLFEIGSLTKTFTALLLVLQVENGQLEYAQNAKSLLPEGKRMPNFEGIEISLEQLASHTSALPRLPDNLLPPDPSNPYVHYTADDLYVFLSYWELERKPGEKYDYSNLGMGLLGHLMATRAEVSFEEMVVASICRPLGMNDTYITLPDDARSRLAKPYNADGAEVSYWDVGVLSGAGGLRSTTSDVLKYLRAQMRGDTSGLSEAMETTQAARYPADQDDLSIGLGWHVKDDGTCVHTGGTGGFASYATFNAEHDVGVVILCNTAAAQAYELGPKVRSIMRGEPYEPFEIRAVAHVEPESLERFTGRFELFPGFQLLITRDGDRLMAQATSQSTFRIYPESEFEFFYRVVDAQITFVPNEDGSVDKLVLHQGGRDLPAQRIE